MITCPTSSKGTQQQIKAGSPSPSPTPAATSLLSLPPKCPERPPPQSQRPTVKCRHCGLTLRRRNLRLHLRRKHKTVREAITAAQQLRAQCLTNNGVFAVAKSFTALTCFPFHVKNKTWGQHLRVGHLQSGHTVCSPLHTAKKRVRVKKLNNNKNIYIHII